MFPPGVGVAEPPPPEGVGAGSVVGSAAFAVFQLKSAACPRVLADSLVPIRATARIIALSRKVKGAQQHLGVLIPGQRVDRSERAVPVAVDDTMPHAPGDVGCGPEPRRSVVKWCFVAFQSLRGVLADAEIDDVFRALLSRQCLVRTEGAVRIAIQHPALHCAFCHLQSVSAPS